MSRGQYRGKLFADQRDGESLDVYSVRCVAPTTGEMKQLNSEVDEFVRFLQQRFSTSPHTVAKVIKSGSLGKGTAVRGTADIDLVMYLNNVRDIYHLQKLREPVLDSLEETIESYKRWQGRVRQKKRTKFSVSYYLDGNEVDLLPAFALDTTNDTRNRDAMYKHMDAVAEKEGMGFVATQFSASLAPLQVTFVKHVDESVKKVIRLLKKWKKEAAKKDETLNDLRSYTLELLTIYASRQAEGVVSTEDLLAKVLDMLCKLDSQRGMYFEENYTVCDARPGDRLVHTPPFLLDVANFYNDMLHRVDRDTVCRHASDALRTLRG